MPSRSLFLTVVKPGVSNHSPGAVQEMIGAVGFGEHRSLVVQQGMRTIERQVIGTLDVAHGLLLDKVLKGLSSTVGTTSRPVPVDLVNDPSA